MTTPGEVTRAILRDLPRGPVVPEHIGPVVLKYLIPLFEQLRDAQIKNGDWLCLNCEEGGRSHSMAFHPYIPRTAHAD